MRPGRYAAAPLTGAKQCELAKTKRGIAADNRHTSSPMLSATTENSVEEVSHETHTAMAKI